MTDDGGSAGASGLARDEEAAPAGGSDPRVVASVARMVEQEFAERPPTIAVIGLSGVGKSSTINAMFGLDLTVSGTTRGTSKFSHERFHLFSDRMEGARLRCALRVYDAVGLGEDAGLDASYLRRYRSHLPNCDVALWIVAARNRALALDQQYLKKLRKVLPNFVIGINQIDLVDPLDWDEDINMPSAAQEAAIDVIVRDRREKLAEYSMNTPVAIPYSAKRYYNLQTLFAACLRAAPEGRRWMFDLIKSFSTHDWLRGARGLSSEQRTELARRYITSDQKLRAEQLSGEG